MSVGTIGDFKIEPIPENLFREPVEYIFADHFRQRRFYTRFDQVSAERGGDLTKDEADLILRFLKNEMAQHLADEEDDLFPLLRRRCKPEDKVGEALQLLTEEHERDAELAKIMTAGLKKLAAGKALENKDEFLRAQATFTEAHRRHLAWENAVVLPLARRRLTSADMIDLGHSMAARRKIEFPE